MQDKIKKFVQYILYALSVILMIYTIYTFVHSGIELSEYYRSYEEKLPFFTRMIYGFKESLPGFIGSMVAFLAGNKFQTKTATVSKPPIEIAVPVKSEKVKPSMDMTRAELLEIAKDKDIKVLSKDTKEEILKKITEKK